jgi:hypothetical protein
MGQFGNQEARNESGNEAVTIASERPGFQSRKRGRSHKIGAWRAKIEARFFLVSWFPNSYPFLLSRFHFFLVLAGKPAVSLIHILRGFMASEFFPFPAFLL